MLFMIRLFAYIKMLHNRSTMFTLAFLTGPVLRVDSGIMRWFVLWDTACNLNGVSLKIQKY